MSSLLHITNGDNFTTQLQSLKLEGEIITWREMLCEGKTLNHVGSESFWKARYDFLHQNYKVSKASFIEKTLKEYRSLCNHKKQNQIVLWFDQDLYCQINMLAVLSWLQTNRKDAEISIVSGDELTPFALHTGNKKQLRELYENKVVLTQDDITFADYLWQLYCSDNPISLENVSDYKNYQFPHLESAIKTHLQRFPSVANGLNIMENNILQLGINQKIAGKKKFISSILTNQGNLGFTDVQYEKALNRLKPLFTTFNPVKLTEKGKEILEKQTSYYSCIQNNDVYLGGALKYNFLYNNTSDRILKL